MAVICGAEASGLHRRGESQGMAAGVYIGLERGQHKSFHATADTDCLLYTWGAEELSIMATKLSPAVAAFWRNFTLCTVRCARCSAPCCTAMAVEVLVAGKVRRRPALRLVCCCGEGRGGMLLLGKGVPTGSWWAIPDPGMFWAAAQRHSWQGDPPPRAACDSDAHPAPPPNILPPSMAQPCALLHDIPPASIQIQNW